MSDTCAICREPGSLLHYNMLDALCHPSCATEHGLAYVKRLPRYNAAQGDTTGKARLRTCQHCKRSFKANNTLRIYCSDNCRSRANSATYRQKRARKKLIYKMAVAKGVKVR